MVGRNGAGAGGERVHLDGGMKTAFITGSPAGFIGFHLAPKLRDAGYYTVECDPRWRNGDIDGGKSGITFGCTWQEALLARGEFGPIQPALAVHLAAHVNSIDKRMAAGLDAYQDIV